MSNSTDGPIRISITGRRHEFLIGRSVIQLLGDPDCLCVLKSEDKQTIAITPCSSVLPLSFSIPSSYYNIKGRKFRIYSKPFTEELVSANGWDRMQTQHVFGTYNAEQNAVVFPVKVF